MRSITEKLQLLKETVDYYSVNPVERRCYTQSACKYSPLTLGLSGSKGCAVGRLLNPELAFKIDEEFEGSFNASVTGIWDNLPKEIQSYGKEYLKALQVLHDGDSNWTENGLSLLGEIEVEKIRSRIQNLKL